MSLLSDKIIDRTFLKKKLRIWRTFTLFLIAVIILGSKYINLNAWKINIRTSNVIARMKIEGFIGENEQRDKILQQIKDNKNIKALIIHVNSPGGSLVGGEVLYNNIRAIAHEKPVIAVMDTIAASGGYMAALAADHIIAHYNTITGSIGTIFYSLDITELAKKLGIQINVIKSAELKGGMSPLEKMSAKAKDSIQGIIDNGYNYFVDLVSKRRKLPLNETKTLADGRIYTGSQAVKLKLIDCIGNEEDAIKWLNKQKITGKVEDINTSDTTPISFITNMRKNNSYLSFLKQLLGLVSLYQQ